MKKILTSFSHAFHNIRSHFFHTLLSVLGIVIGVASLVSILSLIDGMEHYAMEQITKTTSLTSITISPNLHRNVNGVRVKKDKYATLRYEDFEDLKGTLTKACTLNYMTSFSDISKVDGKDVGSIFFALGSPVKRDGIELLKGSDLTQEEIAAGSTKAMVNLAFIHNIDSTLKPDEVIGKTILVKNKTITIQTVFDDKSKEPHAGFALTLLSADELHSSPPSLVVNATSIEDVKDLVSQVVKWINGKFGEGNFNVWTNEARVEQATQGFLLFRVIMGMIVGISVVVGGIGIMNVLLISITERTVEIGIRKAVGANRRDLVMQFLAESITVSIFGSLMGLILGVLGTMAAIPIIKAITKIPFYANYTMNTLMIVSVMAVLLGIVFGTYPALRASRLDPVEAIRHE